MRLGFAGTPQFAVPSLDALARSRHTIAAVFTQPDRPAGRGQIMQSSAIKLRATELGIPVHQPPNFGTLAAEAALRSLDLDVLVVVAYGLIFPPGALAAPKLGCLNIHASLLPRWRGAAPIQRALLAGDATTGVTIMRMDVGLDTGPMLATRELAIGVRETAGTLHDRLASAGGDLMIETLDALANGSAREALQPSVGVTYADKVTKAEALIDWRDDAASILRRVRAFNPWPVAQTTLRGAPLRVWEAEPAPAAATDAVAPGTVLGTANGGVEVACGHGALRILRLQLAGRKPLAAQEFVKAQRLAGARFASP